RLGGGELGFVGGLGWSPGRGPAGFSDVGFSPPPLFLVGGPGLCCLLVEGGLGGEQAGEPASWLGDHHRRVPSAPPAAIWLRSDPPWGISSLPGAGSGVGAEGMRSPAVWQRSMVVPVATCVVHAS